MAATRKKSKRSTPRRPKHDWARTWRVASPILGGVCVLALGMGMTFGVERLDQDARRLLAGTPMTVELEGPVSTEGLRWVPQDQLDALISQSQRLLAGRDPMNVQALGDVGQMLERSGWLSGPPRVERVGRDRVRIQADWRVPAAVVRHNGRDHLISWEGLVMPLEFAPGAAEVRAILGAGLAPGDPDRSSRYLKVWPGSDVQAALSLLRLLSEQPYFHLVGAIDVGPLARREPMEIITPMETRVVWGAPPGEFRPGEVTTEVKLARLSSLFRRDGRIDGNSLRMEIHGPLPLRDDLEREP
jgi:hypothetical protein